MLDDTLAQPLVLAGYVVPDIVAGGTRLTPSSASGSGRHVAFVVHDRRGDVRRRPEVAPGLAEARG